MRDHLRQRARTFIINISGYWSVPPSKEALSEIVNIYIDGAGIDFKYININSDFFVRCSRMFDFGG